MMTEDECIETLEYICDVHNYIICREATAIRMAIKYIEMHKNDEKKVLKGHFDGGTE